LFVWFNVHQHNNEYIEAAAMQNYWLMWLRMADENTTCKIIRQAIAKNIERGYTSIPTITVTTMKRIITYANYKSLKKSTRQAHI